jgi:catechol-2,3-dioxygenase
MSIEGICELTLEARDMAALEAFYTDVIGLEVISRDDDRIWLAAGPRARLGIWSPGRKEFGDEGGRHVHFAFAVQPGTLGELSERLRLAPVEHPGGDRSLYVEDPEGNVMECWDFFARGEGRREGVDALKG